MSEYQPYKDREWLYENYGEKKLSIHQIAKLIGCGRSTVNRWLRKFNIKIRTRGEATTLRYSKIEAIYKSKKWLYLKYWTEGLSASQVAQCCGVGRTAIQAWLKRLDIPRRTQNWKAFKSGSKHRRWQGGTSSYWRSIGHGVWCGYWGEKIPNGYLIHHIDKDITNNNIANLALVTCSFHAIIRERNKKLRKKK